MFEEHSSQIRNSLVQSASTTVYKKRDVFRIMHRWINVSLQSSQPNHSFYWYGETWIVHSLNPCFILSCTFIGPAKIYVRTVLTLFALSNKFLDYKFKLSISWSLAVHYILSIGNQDINYQLWYFYFLYCVGTGTEMSVHWCYGLDDPGFQSWKGQEIVLFSKMFRLTGAHLASYHWLTQFVPRSKVVRESSFITSHLHSLLRLRMSVNITLRHVVLLPVMKHATIKKNEWLPQYTFIVCVWKTLLTSYTLFPLYLPQFTVKD
jgi:hypothetical protein